MPRGVYKKSPEHRRKIGEWMKGNKNGQGSPRMKGKHHTEEAKRKISEARKGKNAWNWKGGITPKNLGMRNEFRLILQKQIYERDNYTCQACGVRGGLLQIDHIQPWAEYVKGRFDINNCRTLCVKCHYKITWGKDMPEDVKTWGQNLKEVFHAQSTR